MILFDIGANEGIWCIEKAKNCPDCTIYAFEPVPSLYAELVKKTKHLNNIKIFNKAIDLESGLKQFNVSKQSVYGNHGCSSFLHFSEKSKTEWFGRNDFEVIDRIVVETCTLESIIDEYKIQSIDYIKIDTQGWDIKVLQSLGNKIEIIKGGELEAGTKDDILYWGQNTELESVSFLINNGFEIESIESNDQFRNEVNIKFKQK
jgi:FkbM family methyltransferase